MITGWHNTNEYRAYPLDDNASCIADNGKSLPTNIIVDLGIVTPGIIENIYVKSVYVSPNIVSIVISCPDGALLACSYSITGLKRYTTLPMTTYRDSVSGWITLGNFVSDNSTQYIFSDYERSLVSRSVITVVPQPKVSEIAKYYGDDHEVSSGLIKLSCDSNFTITQSPNDPNTIIIRLAEAAQTALTEPCSHQASEDICGLPPIRRIAGVPANSDGDIYISFE